MFIISQSRLNHKDFIKLCSRKVAECENSRTDIKVNIDRDDVFTVWSCKTLQNSKCLMSCTHSESYYYEFTMNGDDSEIYMDIYSKIKHSTLTVDGDEKVENIKKTKVKKSK